jgi:hypothetical protein
MPEQAKIKKKPDYILALLYCLRSGDFMANCYALA